MCTGDADTGVRPGRPVELVSDLHGGRLDMSVPLWTSAT